jgi:hypothetical protein
MERPQADLSQAGDFCQSCLKFWKDQGLDPQTLVQLRTRTEHGHAIVVCPYCDGEPVLQSAQ